MTPADPEISFAVWRDPVTAITVSYSLPLFHEIDFQVNEGYRRIPHGGVEVGGLLYGKLDFDALSFEAFRPIECEHESGPSFQLSERDLVNLQESILASSKDEELQGLIPLGWFISHTRSPLRMTVRELQLFERFFPEPKRATVLVKPERFKPTRFTFLLRDALGKINPDGERDAVILPLPGRPGKSGSISAPTPISSIPAPVSKADSEPRPAVSSAARPIPIRPPESESPTDRSILPGEGQPAERSGEIPRALLPERSPVSTPPEGTVIASLAGETGRARASARVERSAKRSRPGRLLLVLGLAALLGCGAGYWAYLQLPPPYILLRAKKRTTDLLVMWDPAQTRSSRYAVIRINDSPPVLLTNDQKSSGIAQVPLEGDSVKVEIVTQHWPRDSRGIIRFLPARPLPAAR